MTSADPGAFSAGDATIVRCLVLVATALVGGVALLRPLTGPLNTATRRLVAAAAGAAAVGIVEVAVAGRAAWVPVIVAAFAVAVVPVTLRRPAVAAVAGLLVTAATAVEAGTGRGWMAVGTGVAHSAAAAVWVAAMTIVAAADAGIRRALVRRLMPVAGAAGVLVAATGVVRAWLDGLRADATTADSTFARVVALKVALLVGVTVAGVLGYHRLRRVDTADRAAGGRAADRAVVFLRISAIGLTGALVAGAALAALDLPPAPPVPGAPLLRTATVGTARLPVVVVPQRPGWNLVHVGADGAMVGVDRGGLVPATARPGTAGGWALVRLPAGQSRLWIRLGAAVAALRLDTGRSGVPADGVTGPDGPECVSAVLGGLVAGRDVVPVDCPADRLTEEDAASLAALVKYLAGRGFPAVTVLDDPSPRSRAAAAVVRAAAARHRLTVAPGPRVDSAVIVIAGWAAADGALRGMARGEVPGLGAYLAPWLANAHLLAYRSGAVVALRYDPRGVQPLRYVSALRSRFAGEAATTAGYDAWRAVTGTTVTGRTYLYAAAAESLLPAESTHEHGTRGGWLPDGAITRVTPALEG